jgi:hypothetical protein
MIAAGLIDDTRRGPASFDVASASDAVLSQNQYEVRFVFGSSTGSRPPVHNRATRPQICGLMDLYSTIRFEIYWRAALSERDSPAQE